MKKKILIALAVLVMLTGAAMAVYPLIVNGLYQKQQEELADYYDSVVYELPEEQSNAQWQDCWDYNESLLEGGVRLTDPFDAERLNTDTHPYVDLLDLTGDGTMGSIEIPAIRCNLMIYHGTDEDVLQKGVGHLQGSSLPVGGTGSHAVLSAHTGLPGKELFTNLDQLETGDVFYLHILGETLAYQVDQIRVVLPEETEDLRIDAQQDYVTLVTCTPYGVNSHRLLVRGTRIPYEVAEELRSTAPQRGSTWATQYIRAVLAGVGIVAVLVLLCAAVVFLRRRRKTPC